MPLCAFMGDELTAAGFRLAGVEVHVPSRAVAPAMFRRLAAEAELVILTAEVAGWLPAEEVRRLMVAVIADVRGQVLPSELSTALKLQLGMAE
jgi:vacuolar-type H+-ATPase subunit F/Vma7